MSNEITSYTSFPILYEPFRIAIRETIFDILSGYNLEFDNLRTKYIPYTGCEKDNANTHITGELIFSDTVSSFSAISNTAPNNITFTYSVIENSETSADTISFTKDNMIVSRESFTIGVGTAPAYTTVTTTSVLDEELLGDTTITTSNTTISTDFTSFTLTRDGIMSWGGEKIVFTNTYAASFGVSSETPAKLHIHSGKITDDNTINGSELILCDHRYSDNTSVSAGNWQLVTATENGTVGPALVGNQDGSITWRNTDVAIYKVVDVLPEEFEKDVLYFVRG